MQTVYFMHKQDLPHQTVGTLSTTYENNHINVYEKAAQFVRKVEEACCHLLKLSITGETCALVICIADCMALVLLRNMDKHDFWFSNQCSGF